ncbi:ATP-binding protein [Hyphomicrobium sp. ghe19]|uniref:sensor histidine kinase n=1 Tax=Hyphomicrobium sp. ghe19 TaxID=2682968 RepID=UPI00136767B6|nr:Signal-transduction histidine kinase senX3 [Hyphomicrobium sp. ghe19]
MLKPRLTSIRMQLALIFFCILGLVMLLGLFSISLLHNLNRLSAAVADEWLPTTRAIGDLNNYTSDFRAMEGAYLLASTDEELENVTADMKQLTELVDDAAHRFEALPHEPADFTVYRTWKREWEKYLELVISQRALVLTGQKTRAIAAYMNSSGATYVSESHMLDVLTDQTVNNAQAAKARLSGGYSSSLSLIWLTISVVAAIVAAALLYIRRLISLPLRQLTDCMHRLARNDTGIEIPGTLWQNEIGEMARAAVVFRSNAIDLMRSRAILANEASMLSERLLQEQKLVANQRNFVSMASHEFRTPLTIIDGHARRLLKFSPYLDATEVAGRAGKIRSAVSRMVHAINNLLTSSRVLEGITPDFAKSEIDLRQLLAEVAQLHRDLAPIAQITEHYAGHDLKVVGDQTLLFYVFSNLLANAVKYSLDGGGIQVEAKKALGGVSVSIIDRGIGIPEEDRDRLFERFRRGSNVASIVGTGMGLFLVKMVLDSHGAKIDVSSKVGEGSRFTVWLPDHLPAMPQPEIAVAN